MSNRRDDDLAYGNDYSQGNQGGDGERGFIGDVGKRLFGRNKQSQNQGQQSDVTQSYQPHLSGGQQQQYGSGQPQGQQKPGGFDGLFNQAHSALHGLGAIVKDKMSGNPDSRPQYSASTAGVSTTGNRYGSFALERSTGNDTKWYVDGCSYMWAVSVALERARESIWILDWWLSPELYLRRPPAKNEQYRVDRVLKAAAERGVKVNVIVYKEVTQALTRKLLNPSLPDYLHSLLPPSTDPYTRFISRVGLDVTFKALEVWEEEDPLIAPPIAVSSSHTKHALEDLHPNIAVFRHPDHIPDQTALGGNIINSFSNLSFSAAGLSKLPGDALKGIYGMHEGSVLYWAHHEKLCLIDGRTAFMGGLDLCYGRWDTHQHPIADVHPTNLDDIVFPGQDYNNARIMDFQDVVNWQNNKLDRTKSSRMGWSDVSLCLSGPAVDDLKTHFAQRWNFIYKEKYSHKNADARYGILTAPGLGAMGTTQAPAGASQQGQNQGGYYPPPPQQGQRGFEGEQSDRGFLGGDDDGDRGLFGRSHGHGQGGGLQDQLFDRINHGLDKLDATTGGKFGQYTGHSRPSSSSGLGGASCQITRSCAKWSHGDTLEHSIQNAYCEVIRNSEHFVYIENQFFITATGDQQKPIKNRIGEAMVERILRAARNNQKYQMIIVIPAVPAFAGDLKKDDALSTRAIMEFQYDSINRGGHSIYETIAKAGFNPMDYIRFYNLRNYDRLNVSGVMAQVEQQSGVKYEDARKEHDAAYGAYATQQQPPPGQQNYPPPPAGPPPGHSYPGQEAYHQQQEYQPSPVQQTQQQTYQPYRPQAGASYGEQQSNVYEIGSSRAVDNSSSNYNQYQQGAQNVSGPKDGRWDSVAECYMLNGPDIRTIPWTHGAMSEIDAFVSEELYVHSKLLIADDRIVICGSANLNDRSQLGDHDSEIAIVINDPTPVDSRMNNTPFRASKFAATLRRTLFRKHLGLLKPQDMTSPDANFEPIGTSNTYDFGSPEDNLVTDPLADGFLNFWNSRARTNTESFGRVFHPVPSDNVRNWKQYDEYYSRFYAESEVKGDPKQKTPSKYKWGHVVAEEFPEGEAGVREVKEVLSQIKGTLVEMPLLFLKEEDIAKEGLGLNAFTEEVYT